MPKTVEAPADFLEELANFLLPESTQRRLESLMDRNTEGALGPDEAEELNALVEMSERISLLKGRALLILGRGNG